MYKLLSLKIPGSGGTPVVIQTPEGIPSGSAFRLSTLVRAAIELMIIVGIIAALLYLVYGGLFWITSRGDKEQLDKARRIIVYSIIGLIVMSLSMVIVNLFSQAVGVDSVIGR